MPFRDNSIQKLFSAFPITNKILEVQESQLVGNTVELLKEGVMGY